MHNRNFVYFSGHLHLPELLANEKANMLKGKKMKIRVCIER